MTLKLKDIKMRPKLLGLFVLTGIIPLAILGVWCSILVRSALITRSNDQLEAVREIKKAQIQQFFDTREGDVEILVETVKALQHNAYQRIETVQELKKAYIEDYVSDLQEDLRLLSHDPLILDAVSDFAQVLDDPDTRVLSPDWNTVAERYDERLDAVMQKNGWNDLFLILPSGDIAYTAARKNDLGLNVETGKLQDSGLGKAFKMAQSQDSDSLAIADFEPYAPSGGTFTAFMMAPVYHLADNIVGYVAFQMPTSTLNTIMQHRQGMGDTGESYLVGKWEGQSSYRSDRVVKSGKVGEVRDGESIEAALDAKTSGQNIKVGSTGVLEVETYTPLSISGLNWAIITTQSVEEIIASKINKDDDEEDYFSKYISSSDYANLFLIHSSGDVFYSATREVDYGTNMVTGKYKDSGLGKLVQYILQTRQFAITDFEPYEPANNEPAAFIAKPVLDAEEQVEFIVALQLSLESINDVMLRREGMGESGETYLVGSDMLMRSDSSNDSANRTVKASFANSTNGRVETEAVKKALAGVTETQIIKNYADKTVLSAYTPMIVGATTWVLLAEIESEEVTRPIIKLIWSIFQGGAVIVAIVAVFALFIAKDIANPLAKSVEFTKAIANGNLDADIDVLQKDEIGMLASALRNMKDTIRDVLKTLETQVQAVQEGTLDSRADAATFAGGWNELIVGINQLTSTLVGHIDNVPIATKITDKEFNIRYISKTGLEMLGGMDRDDVIGKKCYNMFNSSACGTSHCTCARAAESGDNEEDEAELNLAGRQYYMSTIGVPIFNADGDVLATMEIMVDQTAIRNAMDSARHTAEGLLDSVQDLTVSSQEISTTSNEQAAAVKEIVSTMEDSDQLAKSIAGKINDVTEITNDTKGVVNSGFSVLRVSLAKMQEIQQANSATLSEIKLLNNRIGSIWDIVNMINIIAAQTKIIAFNAELEASSAGEAGENFQIVASEIRRLADNIVEATDDIKMKITEIQHSSDSLIEVSEAGTVKITEGLTHSQNLQQLFEEVLSSAEISATASDRIALSIKQQVSAFEQILQTLKQISEGVDSFVVSTRSTTGAAEKMREMANSLHSVIEEYTGREEDKWDEELDDLETFQIQDADD